MVTCVFFLLAMPLNCGVDKINHINFVLIFVDDMGYGDVNRTGHPTIQTPNLDQMADEGVMMTQFYSVASVCTPSRAALLTGRYPIRNGMTQVFFPNSTTGLPPSEITLAEILKSKGYKTACIGKWHLGHLPEFLPTRHGFDYYYGIPYSNDMTPDWPYNPSFLPMPELPLMRNEDIIEQPCDQATLTRRYTEETIRFIENNKDRPFFCYLPHTMPHLPLHCSENFRGKSKRGLYGDVIEELDWSVGQILNTLRKLNLDQNTIVVFTSDNGPSIQPNLNVGSAGLLRGSKHTTWEGGLRVPFIVWAADNLPGGTVSMEVGTTMDLFTTLLEIADAEIPTDRIIDGKNLLGVWKGQSKSPHKSIYFYHGRRLTAVRYGKHKLHLWKNIPEEIFGKWVKCDPYELFNVEKDPSEKYNIADKNIEIVRAIEEDIIKFKAQL